MTGFGLPAGPAAPCHAEPSGVEARRGGGREHLASATLAHGSLSKDDYPPFLPYPNTCIIRVA